MSPAGRYLKECVRIMEVVAAQERLVQRVAGWFARAIAAGRVVHVFGAGHSRIAVEEMWPRYGSFPGFNPIVELSMTFHNPVVGSNGQRQAMFLENTPGLAARILCNFNLSRRDIALVISSGGCNVVPIEMAMGFRKAGMKVAAIVSVAHSRRSRSNHPSGRKLGDVAHLTLDTGAPPGDAMVKIPGLPTPVSPGSTIGSCMLINTLKAETAELLTRKGKPPKVLTAPCLVGPKRSAALFESAYDEHGRRLARLLSRGKP